jgi:hypothetical protein
MVGVGEKMHLRIFPAAILINLRSKTISRVFDGSSPIIKIESERKSVIKIDNTMPKIGKFIFEPSPGVLNGVEVRRTGR